MGRVLTGRGWEMDSPHAKSDAEVAEEIGKWFGSFFKDRPNQCVSFLLLAQLAIRAMDGDPAARQIVMEGDTRTLFGTAPEGMMFAVTNALNLFHSVAAGTLNDTVTPDPETFVAESLAWAERWERHTYRL